MSETPGNSKTVLWPKNGAIYAETLVIILLAISIQFLQQGNTDFKTLLSYQTLLRISGSLCIWFVNKFTLERILQARIDSNKVTQFLPFELLGASVVVTSIIYLVFYFFFIYLDILSFALGNFLTGILITVGFCLLIVIIYIGGQIWRSWWSDGEFLLQINEPHEQDEPKEFITIETPQGTSNIDLNEISYFQSESRIVFLVDTSGKKWITQFNLTELENSLDQRFFRLNRSIIVSRKVISHMKKLPNHRLRVTIVANDEDHTETISRYKSTRFKQWFLGTNP